MKSLLRFGVTALAALSLGGTAHAATITIINNNADGVGFNDPTPADPVGGNSGTTKGQQALNIFTRAAQIWGATLQDDVEIKILASFEPLACTATAGTLGSAGPLSVNHSDPSFPRQGVWYTAALSNKFAGSDLDPGSTDNPSGADIRARFNSNIGTPTCLAGSSWYMGLDANHGAQTDLLTVLLHEFAHGLGFLTLVDKGTGAEFSDGITGFPDIYETFVLDGSTGKHWTEMVDADRATSTLNTGNLLWDGPITDEATPVLLRRGVPRLKVTAPASIAGDNYNLGTAGFGPPVPTTGDGIKGDVVLTTPADACADLTSDVSGKIALIDRGTCAFVDKVHRAQAGGALAVIVADNKPESPAPGLGGTDTTITLTTVQVTQDYGTAIKSALAAGPVSAVLNTDPDKLAGGTGTRPSLYAPVPMAPGSSVSHFDVTATPNLLMEPAINNDLTHHLDLTVPLLRDIGWTTATDLSISKTGPAAIVPGSNAVFQIAVTNGGETDAAAVVVSDATPVGLTFVSTSGACKTAFPCSIGVVRAGTTQTITATYAVPASYTTPDPLINTATVATSTADIDHTNDTATSSTPVAAAADVSIAITDPAPFRIGGNVVYTVTVSNAGPSDAAGVSATNAAPSGLTFVANAGDCTTAYPCALGVVPAGGSKVIRTTYAVPSTYTTPNPVVNTATVTATSADPNPANNSATSTIALSTPVANAGPDQTVAQSSSVTLDGSASTGNGLTYAWTQTAGTAVTLSSAAAAKPTFTAPALVGAPITVTFQLTVTNENGFSSSDSVDVHVVNSATPLANAGPDQTVFVDATVKLDGSGSVDPAGGALTYAWKQTAGPSVTLSSASAVGPSFSANVAGGSQLSFKLTVTNWLGNSSDDTVVITVNSPVGPDMATSGNQADMATGPGTGADMAGRDMADNGDAVMANAGADQTVKPMAAVTLDGSHSTGAITTFVWTQLSGPAVTLSGTDSATAHFTAPAGGGTLIFELTVSDANGHSASDAVTIKVSDGTTGGGGSGGGCGCSVGGIADPVTGPGLILCFAVALVLGARGRRRARA